MKTSQAFVTILLLTTTLSSQASYIAHKEQCPLNMTKKCEQLSDAGLTNVEKGWRKIANTEMSQNQFLSSRPYEVGAQKVVLGAAQIAYGSGQFLIGDIGQLAIKNPTKAIITATTIGCWLYIASI